jgi:ComF family protein
MVIWFGSELKEHHYQEHYDLVIPVPLHRRKLQKRGYNQSDSFARGVAQALNIPWQPHALQRLTDSTTQTKKSRLERWQNVGQIFKVADVTLVQNQRLLVVDDVMTTGATLEACAVVLLEAGAQAVSVATIAAA